MKKTVSKEYVNNTLQEVVKYIEVGSDKELAFILQQENLAQPIRLQIASKVNTERLLQLGFIPCYNHYVIQTENINSVELEQYKTTTLNQKELKQKPKQAKIYKKLVNKLVAECSVRMPDEFDKNGTHTWYDLGKKVLFVYKGKKIIGFAGYQTDSQKPKLYTVYIVTKYRKKGIYKLMLSQLKKEFEQKGLFWFFLSTDTTSKNAKFLQQNNNHANLAYVSYKNTDQIIRNKSEIKTIIFDFDDTLYSGDLWDNWSEYCHKALNSMLNINDKTAFQKLAKKHNLTSDFTGKDIAKVLNAELGSVTPWQEYQDKKMFELDWKKATVVNKKLLKHLSKQYCLIIATNSTKYNVQQYAKKLNINLNCFCDIYCNEFKGKDVSKKSMYQKIVCDYKLNPAQTLVVGNSVKTDLTPAKELGLKTKLVKDATFSENNLFDYNW